ncbi:MAG: type I pullulanase [Ruminococcus sp.]|nr:type I pullulanase [Ruminococcus sp.]
MKLKRILAGVLIMMIIPSFAMFGAYATDQTQDPTQSATEETKSAKKEKPTELVVSRENVGMEKYLRYLENRTYKGNLGATYTKKETTFKLWSPAAQDVKVCIYTTGTDGEDGAQMLSKTSMKLVEEYGTWVLHLKGDYKNKYYTYLVTVNGITNEVVDPYAKAVGANGDRGMVVDLNSTNPKGWNKDKFNRVNNPTDAIIWEVNVRDFSASETSGVSEKHRGKFLAFTQEGTVVDSVEGALPTCIDYLKELGVNYVQINPFYDFASIDETDAVNPQYNWGYDPKNYNVPEGSYSSNPYDGNVRIKECKQMIQALHNAGIGVIMDVVYNHTYASVDSWFNMIVPDYYYRMDDNGNWSNGSGCGNDTASERTMFREFMKNSVVYWADEYHIDGFRFDLMGLHDVDTMNYIRKSLDKLPNGKKIIMYGEAWDLETACASNVNLATQNNLSLLSDRIGAFNDTFRDGLKGNVFDSKDQGFIQSGSNRSKVKAGIEGMATAGTWGVSPNQCINYASCHDNLSLYDKLVASVYPDEGGFRKRREDLVQMNKLSAAITLTSQGVPFMMAGEEMGRSKDGDENSYKSPVEVNQIDYNDLNKYADLNEYYKGLIDIRKTVDVLRDATGEVAKSISYFDGLDDGVIAYSIAGSGNTKTFIAVFNGSNSKSTVKLPSKLNDSYVVIANDKDAGIKNLAVISDGKVTAKAHSSVLLVDKESFDKFKNQDTSCRVIVKYFDTKSDAVVYEQILKGEKGDSYLVEYPNHLLYRYDVTSVSGSKTGEFEKGTAEVTINCKPYSGDYSSITIHFVNENDEDIANSIVMSNRVGQRYTTPKIAGVSGYRLDLENLPENGAGKYTKEDLTITYRYNSIEDPALQEDIDLDDLNSQSVCVANIIYMDSKGEILDKKTYAGDKDTEIVVEYLDIPGYEYISDTADGAVFDSVETNIVVNYEKISDGLNIAVIAGSALLLGLVILALALIFKKRKPIVDGDDIVNDLYIE